MGIPAAFTLSDAEKAAFNKFQPSHSTVFRFPDSGVIRHVKRRIATTYLGASEDQKYDEGSEQQGYLTPHAPIDTYGYDTVFAVHIDEVNRSLAASMGKDIPTDFHVDGSGGLVSYTMNGIFDKWTVSGGSGALLNMTLHLKSGDLDMGLIKYKYPQCNPVSLAGVSIVVQIRLNLLEETIQSEEKKDGSMNDLRMKLERTTENPSPVKYLEMTGLTMECIPEADREAVVSQVEAFVMSGVSDWVMTHADDITFIFTKVRLSSKLAEDGFDWMTPTSTSYAYVDRADDEGGNRSMLGVLNLTDNKDGSSLAQQISPHSIPGDSPAAFLLSREMVMTKILKPSLGAAFEGATEGDFVYDPKSFTVTATKSLTGKQVEDENGKKYTPRFTFFQVSFVSGAIQIDSKTEFNISLGITGHARSTVKYQYILKEGTQEIILSKDHELTADYWCEVSPGAIGLAAGLAVFATCVGAVLMVAGGAGVVVALALSAVLCAGLSATGLAIAAAVGKGQAHDQLTANELVNQAILPFDWTGAEKDMKLSDVKVYECLQLVGDPSFMKG
ncbi:TULIP family P47-like protein [Oceanospirillum maris]|uniref:TULIP family P47-like protein n=1 Tax=Oceanospirillum maris TaxID=64977 RepID=UPI0003F4D768|nr:TULIP family P47-like protein [Oceanospirillum maris]